eukprot:535143-Rhodomonas_salina.4
MGGRVLRLGVRVGHVVDCGFAMKLILHIYLWCQDLTMITENVDIIINCAASINFTTVGCWRVSDSQVDASPELEQLMSGTDTTGAWYAD